MATFPAPRTSGPMSTEREVPGYDPEQVESKWRARWQERGTNQPDLDRPGAEPFYNLMMFPYPSAEGLHVGNMYAFTGSDVYGRYQRLRGKTVFEPIGYDAFGIHSENFAIKMGIHPGELIPRNIKNFRRQLEAVGGMFDWSHTVDTTDPAYYKWTQWLFLQLYKAGKAYKKQGAVNWCPSCKTVLANEQVEGDTASGAAPRSSSGCWSSGSSGSPSTPSGSSTTSTGSTGRTPPAAPSGTGSGARRGRRSTSSPRPGSSASTPPVPTPSSARPSWS